MILVFMSVDQIPWSIPLTFPTLDTQLYRNSFKLLSLCVSLFL